MEFCFLAAKSQKIKLSVLRFSNSWKLSHSKRWKIVSHVKFRWPIHLKSLIIKADTSYQKYKQWRQIQTPMKTLSWFGSSTWYIFSKLMMISCLGPAHMRLHVSPISRCQHFNQGRIPSLDHVHSLFILLITNTSKSLSR